MALTGAPRQHRSDGDVPATVLTHGLSCLWEGLLEQELAHRKTTARRSPGAQPWALIRIRPHGQVVEAGGLSPPTGVRDWL